jgi:predicted amidohydrolase
LFVQGLQAEARTYGLAINVGIHEPGDNPKKVKNTSIWINEDGEIAQKYQKLHLFDMDLKNGPSSRESE